MKQESLVNYHFLFCSHLNKNELTALEVDAFKGATNLQSIYLQHNKISYLVKESVRGFASLHFL